ncbi:MAG TPA: non-homologous end-joining DNA ligase [Anaeromyxobacteraceae bacterium]|nr:non-homologous end-joining DNA ligase [Anaeromyxobacteraceae bacterium]
MAKLDVYDAKRDFRITPEPPPGTPRPRRTGPLTFMIHKHHARRLHYDLRLELEGVLASWSVPKGPSYDPAQKRLAVETEDHPLAYGGFEGRIPDGEYGAGDSIIWDRGTWDTDPPGQGAAMKRKGHVVVVLHGEKLRGTWHLVRTRPAGGKQQWLLFKARDGLENPGYDVVAERPESVASGRRATRGPVAAKTLRAPHPPPVELLVRIWPPMLATLATEDEVGRHHRLEVKYDGFRALAGLSGGKVSLQSRNGLDLSARFPGVARSLSKVIVGEAALDGEIVSSAGFQGLEDGAGVRYVAFDLLWHEGEDLRERPIEERRELLESLLATAPEGVELAEEVEPPIAKAMARARREGWEGVVAKEAGSRYEGRRSRAWLKVKVSASQELAVVGYTPLANGQRGIGALLLGVNDGGRLVYAGKVGTGYSAALRRELLDRLEPERVEAPRAAGAPRMREATWVEPRLVAEIAFTEWTADGKLRHPSFKGLRPDKRPDEVVRERPGAAQGKRGKR